MYYYNTSSSHPYKSEMHPLLISLHIPKAAGSTLASVIRRQFRKREVLFGIWNDSEDEIRELPMAQKQRIRCIHGHMFFGLHRFFPQSATYITFLRHPIDRIISHYNYVLGSKDHYLHHQVVSQNMSLKEYVSSGISKEELWSGQTQMISGQRGIVSNDTLTLAKKNLQEHFLFVGLAEKFDQSLVCLRQKLGWRNTYYYRRNISKKRVIKEELDKLTLDTVRKHNELDLELYEFARSMFEEFLRQYVGSFDADMEAFRTRNRVCGRILMPIDVFLRVNIRKLLTQGR